MPKKDHRLELDPLLSPLTEAEIRNPHVREIRVDALLENCFFDDRQIARRFVDFLCQQAEGIELPAEVKAWMDSERQAIEDRTNRREEVDRIMRRIGERERLQVGVTRIEARLRHEHGVLRSIVVDRASVLESYLAWGDQPARFAQCGTTLSQLVEMETLLKEHVIPHFDRELANAKAALEEFDKST